MDFGSIFFLLIVLVVSVTFLLEVVKPKWEAKKRQQKFEAADHTDAILRREELLEKQQEKLLAEAREKQEKLKQEKEQKALEANEKYLLPGQLKNPRIYGDPTAPVSGPDSKELRQRKLAEEKARRKELAQMLRDNLEPEPIASPDNAGRITSIAIKLPTGGKPLQRKFLCTDTLQKIVDFIDSTELLDFLDYSLVVPYPKKEFQNFEITLEETGLHPNASLLVQEN